MSRFSLAVLLGACAGKGSVGDEADDGSAGDGDATRTHRHRCGHRRRHRCGHDRQHGHWHDVTPPDEETVTSITRIGLTLEIHFETDGPPGPWTISIAGVPTVVAEADLATWDPTDGEGTWAGPYDPCTALGTLVPVEVTDGTLTGIGDNDLVGSTTPMVAPSGNYRDIDLTLLPAPFALCDGIMSDGDFFGRILAFPSDVDWLVTVISDSDMLLSENAFQFTDEADFYVAPGAGFGAPTPFTVFIDAQ